MLLSLKQGAADMVKGISADTADNRWTIRGVPPSYRDKVTKRADRLEMTVGEIVCQALDAQEQSDAQPIEIIKADAPAQPSSDLSAIERVLAMARDFAGQTGRPMRADVRKMGYDILLAVMAERQTLKADKPARPIRSRLIPHPETRHVAESGMVLDSQEREMP